MDNINQYLSSAYEECLHDDVSTCRFFFTEEDAYETTTKQCIEFFGNQSNFVDIIISIQGSMIKDWNDLPFRLQLEH